MRPKMGLYYPGLLSREQILTCEHFQHLQKTENADETTVTFTFPPSLCDQRGQLIIRVAMNWTNIPPAEVYAHMMLTRRRRKIMILGDIMISRHSNK